MMRPVMGLAAALAVAMSGGTVYAKMVMQTFPVPAGAGAHDVYPAADGTVWFTAQSAGKLGHLDPRVRCRFAGIHGTVVAPGEATSISNSTPIASNTLGGVYHSELTVFVSEELWCRFGFTLL